VSLTVENLSFSYGRHAVLQGVSFAAQAGELLAILGPNGVGKTTLFKCVMGLARRYTGTIRADGVDLAALSPRERAHRVAAIPQAHPLSFRYSAFDMVLMGTSHALSPFAVPGERERAAARDAMARVNIAPLADRPFDHLSGGEQQLVFIARALCQQAKILLMDEPTASLDYGNRLLVLGVARDLSRAGYTVLLSTHDPQHALWYADRALALHEGKVLAQGATREVVVPDVLQQLYGRPFALLETEQGPVLVPKEGN
jgi:iron complex transport system ATP-binding protein